MMIYSEHSSHVPTQDSGKAFRWRLYLLRIVFAVLFGLIGGRLFRIQVLDSSYYRGIAREQYQSTIPLLATRGNLLDRNGDVLASSAVLVSYYTKPKYFQDSLISIAKAFSKAFGKPVEHYLEKMNPKKPHVWLERHVLADTLRNPIPETMKGIYVESEPARLYHHGVAGGQLLGWTDNTHHGSMGIEMQMDSMLAGKNGFTIFQKDAYGAARPEIEYPRTEPVDGDNVSLTIDLQLQSIAEEELKNGVEKNKAEGGLAIIMNPNTGEVLATAQYPFMDPNNISESKSQDRKLRMVTDRLEPGSVFKLVTTSAGIENDVIKVDDLFDAETGKWAYRSSQGKVLRMIIDDHPHSVVTVQEAMEASSNIVMAKIGLKVGNERFYKMARAFGFGIKTNIDYPGEVGGVLRKPKDWSKISLVTMAYGYEVGVTPLQLMAAYSVVANGGYLMKPYVVKRVTDHEGKVIQQGNPQMIRRVLSPSTVATMKDLFEGVVAHGTGSFAQIPGLRIAGKTGTAKHNVNGIYVKGDYTATFVGFFPVENPKFVCLVMLDKPKGASYYAGSTSAPVFHNIVERMITTTDLLGPFVSPNTLIARHQQDSLMNAALNASITANKLDSNMMIQPREDFSPEERLVPNVQGMSVRRAVSVLSDGEFEPVIEGSGIVMSQVPVAGSPVARGTVITLRCAMKADAPKSQVVLTKNQR